MDNLQIKCLVHRNMNVCFWNKNYKEKNPSQLLCHKCILERQDQLSKYQDLYDVNYILQNLILEEGFKNQDSIVELNFKVLYERVVQIKSELVDTFLKLVEELNQKLQFVISYLDELEREVKVNLDSLDLKNEIEKLKEQLKQEEWDSQKKHDEFHKMYMEGLKKGQIEYQKQMLSYTKLINDKKLFSEIELKINQIQQCKQNILPNVITYPLKPDYDKCHIVKEVRKPTYQLYQIKQILYQNTEAEYFFDLIKSPQQGRYFLFFKKQLKVVINRNHLFLNIRQYSKNGEEKVSVQCQAEFQFNQNFLNITKPNKQSIFKAFKSLKHVFIYQKPISIDKLVVLDQFVSYDLFQPNFIQIREDDFLLQI